MNITKKKVKKDLDKIISANPRIEDSIREGMMQYESKEQFAASRLLCFIDMVIHKDSTDPGHYWDFSSKIEIPSIIKPLIKNFEDVIIQKRLKENYPTKEAYSNKDEEKGRKAREQINKRFEEETKLKKKLNIKLIKYRQVYRQTFEKLGIEKMSWWDT